MEGKPRTARRCTVDKTCPLPPPEERLVFVLTSLKTSPLQVVQGRLCGRVQGKAKQGIPVLLPVRLATLRALGAAPTRSRTALAQRRGVSAADVATGVTPLAADAASMAVGPTAVPVSPLWPMTARHGGSSAPKSLRHRRPARRLSIKKHLTSSPTNCCP
jgi:hypothetical protein